MPVQEGSTQLEEVDSHLGTLRHQLPPRSRLEDRVSVGVEDECASLNWGRHDVSQPE